MSQTLFIVMIFAEILYFALIILFINKKTLSLKYTFMWLFGGAVMVIFTLFPNLFITLIKMSGVTSVMNGLFAMCIFFVMIILMSLTSIASKQADTIRKLVQDNALLEKRIRDLENNKENDKETN